jgi:SAM-dependent methyltransferase
MLRRDINRRTDPDDWVLDLGTKHGDKAVHIDAKVVAVDIELQSRHGGLAYVQADGFRLPFRADTFDYVSCSQVFEHIPDTEAFAAEISRVLKSDGAALIDFPNRLFPDRPHSPPGYFSLLPRPLALRLAPKLLNPDQERYYRNHVYNLSPVGARRALHAHFESVKYVTLRQKVAYRPIFLGDVEDPVYSPGRAAKVFARLLPVITLLMQFPPAGWLFELLYPHAAYECREPSRGCKR